MVSETLEKNENGHADQVPQETDFESETYLGYAFRASLVAQMVKDLPEMQESQVRSLGREDPLEKGMATHSSILA